MQKESCKKSRKESCKEKSCEESCKEKSCKKEITNFQIIDKKSPPFETTEDFLFCAKFYIMRMQFEKQETLKSFLKTEKRRNKMPCCCKTKVAKKAVKKVAKKKAVKKVAKKK